MHVPSYCSSSAPCQLLSQSCCYCRAYKTISYLVQQLFSHFQGVIAADTSVKTTFGDVHQELVAASTTCQDAKCKKVAVKVTYLCRSTDLRCHEPIPSRKGSEVWWGICSPRGIHSLQVHKSLRLSQSETQHRHTRPIIHRAEDHPLCNAKF